MGTSWPQEVTATRPVVSQWSSVFPSGQRQNGEETKAAGTGVRLVGFDSWVSHLAARSACSSALCATVNGYKNSPYSLGTCED